MLGFGAGALGSPALTEAEAGRFLNAVLDSGVALIDTARSYGLSEERIGRHVAHRREEIVLSTKVGYGVPGYEDWTGPCVRAGVDLALTRLRTDVLDVVHLHSCPLEVLRREDVVSALTDAVRAGKVRVAAYSGENEALEWAITSGAFGSIQCSVNVCDQRSLVSGVLAAARERQLGIIAKRPLANAAWTDAVSDPNDVAAAAYRERWRALDLDTGGLDHAEFALRFALSQPSVDCAIVGTRSIEHLRRLLAAAARGPLTPELVGAATSAFAAKGSDWRGQV